MARTDFTVNVNQRALRYAINGSPGTAKALSALTSQVVDNANALGSGFRTKRVTKDGQKLGGKKPLYMGDVADRGKGPVGIVHPGNYAAMKDNYEHNTMLKAMR